MPAPSNGRWQDRILDKLDAQQKRDRRSIAVNLDNDQRSAVIRAAAARGLSMSAFLRRAALAVAVHDGHGDWFELNAHERRVRPLGDKGSDPIRAAGSGFGPWRITGMEEHRGDDAS